MSLGYIDLYNDDIRNYQSGIQGLYTSGAIPAGYIGIGYYGAVGTETVRVSYNNKKSTLEQNQCIIFATKGATKTIHGIYERKELLLLKREATYFHILEINPPAGWSNNRFQASAPQIICQAARKFFDQDSFNSFVTTNSSYTFWCIYRVPTRESQYSSRVGIAYCHDLGQLKRLNKLKTLENSKSQRIDSNISISKQLYMSEIGKKDYSEPEGFFLNAGYYKRNEDGKTVSVYEASNSFIGVNNNVKNYARVSLSSITSDAASLVGYYNIYVLTSDGGKNSDDAQHYKVYKSGSSGTIGDGSSSSLTGGTMSDYQVPISPLEVDWSASAVSISKNYIQDFSNWKVNLIPPKGENKDNHKVEHYLTLNMKNKDNYGGTKNLEVIKPMIRTKTFEIDLDRLAEQLDKAINISESFVSGGFDDQRQILLSLVRIYDKNKNRISLSTYFSLDKNKRKNYSFIYYDYNRERGVYEETNKINFNNFIDDNAAILKNILNEKYSIDLTAKQEQKALNLYNLELFEAYTRGHDFIQENYTTVRAEERDPHDDSETSRIMSYKDNYFTYKYTGRNIDIFCGDKKSAAKLNVDGDYNFGNEIYCNLIHSSDLLQESDVTLGETYNEQKYFVEAIKAPVWTSDSTDEIKKKSGRWQYKDSFKIKDYIDKEQGGYDSTLYTEDDLEVLTSTIDLLQCKYYCPELATYENNWCDCKARTLDNDLPAVECIYQKNGYCPYRFQTEKHPRRIRTLQQEKSNRFNLIQELSEVFKIYPCFYIEHDNNGKIILDENGCMKKHVFFMTEKGKTNKLGFRYEKNLSSINRTLDSSSITTKLYVENVDCESSKTGVCSIQTATDNIGKNSYILDFSYYAKIGTLDKVQLQKDIYGLKTGDFAFLPRIGEYNKLYDKYSNLIITMTGQALTELEAQNTVSIEGITTALEERKKIGQTMYQYKSTYTKTTSNSSTKITTKVKYTTSDTYKNYVTKYREQSTILWGLIEQLFFTGNYFCIPVGSPALDDPEKTIYTFYNLDYSKDYSLQNEKIPGLKEMYNKYRTKYCKGELFMRLMMEGFNDEDYKPPFTHWNDFKKEIVDTKIYEVNGGLGKYRKLYNEVLYWKRERAKVLNKINDLSEQFYKKYEPYIKEGTFTDSNYLDDNEYYWAGVQVLDDSCEPQISYSISVVDLEALPEYSDDYSFDLADTTFIEDIDFFGINKKTGLPNREKVIVSGIEYDLDIPTNNTINVQNYTSKFDDLFQTISASVQSLTFNENIYKRASNFSAKQYIETDTLQNTLDIGDLTLLDTPKDNIKLDESGTEGNDINNAASQYKITGEGVYFSKDGGETWDYGVGPNGINLDYAKFGNLDASKVQIVDGDYIYFLWDKDGINAYRSPAASTDGLVDFARFNRYGLSLIENNNIRLRAGYEFKSGEDTNTTGNYKEELPLTNQNVGFYLYNDSGKPIFKTETRSNYSQDSKSDYTARLSLTGEMFVTNKILDDGALGRTSQIHNSLITLSHRMAFKTTSVYEYDWNQYTNMIVSIKNEITNEQPTAVDIAGNKTFKMTMQEITENGNKYYTYTSNLNDNTIYYITPTINSQNQTCTLNIIEFNFNLLNVSDSVNLGDLTVNMKDFIESLLNGDNVINTLSSNFSNSAVLNNNYSTNNFIGTYSTKEDSYGKSLIPVQSYTLAYENESESVTISSNSNIQYVNIDYIDLQGQSVTKLLYVYQNGNELSYWCNRDVVDDVSVGSINTDFSASEIGVFLNNKKALDQNNKDYNDKTSTLSQKYTSELSDEEWAERQTSILSGAERTFMIAAAGEEDSSYKCHNILSVLKNGVLYIGGEVSDYYGRELNISGMQYMPDEVRITNPKILMSNNGQIWCDWSEFYYAAKGESGELICTKTSLKSVIDNIIAWSNQIGTSTGSSTTTTGDVGTSGYYIDEDDVNRT